MDLGITNKTALITGGDSGIGKATAKNLLDEGATVIITDIEEKELKQTAEKLGKNCLYCVADLTDNNDIKQLAEFCKDKVGMPDILVNCAGITGAKGDPLKLSDDDWTECWDVDFFSVVKLARAFLPAMADKGWGRFVATTSENAVQPYWEEAVYNTAKAGILNFTKGLSRKYAEHGVLVNAVSPAFIETPMTDGMMEKRAKKLGVSKEDAIESFLKEERPYLALKRRGQPEEVAAVIAFLCSDLASFVNGSNYRVDGGAVATMGI